ncbi:MAG: DUF4139 domain-containing protein [Bacteroidia bacterium]|nr:DUF4139 domain-containing protein [Bacteroidia bacterium]
MSAFAIERKYKIYDTLRSGKVTFAWMDTLLPLVLTLAHVTVYPQGALYRYTGVASVQKGVNTLVWEGLPPQTNPQSLRVSVAASARGYIAQTSIEPLAPYLNAWPTDVERLRRRIDSLEAILSKVNQRLGVLNLQEKILTENSRLGGEEGATKPEDIERYLGLVERRLTQVLEEKTPLEKRRASLTDTLAHLRLLYENRLKGLQTQRSAVFITYWAPQAEVFPIRVELSGPPASWELSYRIRALPAQGKVIFQRWASIQNLSGEDWRSVELSLSTGTPERSEEMPPFQPWVVDIATPGVPLLRMKEIASESFSAQATESEAEQSALGSVPVQTDQVLTRTYHLGKQHVAAGARRTQLFLRADTLPATFRFFVNAPAIEAAYLRAGLPVSALSLWEPAPAIIEAEGQEVARIFWNPTFSEDTLWLDLGRSPFVQVKRTPLLDRRETRLSGGTIHHHFGYTLRLAHTYTAPIQVVLWERIPISRNAEIKVEVTDPAGGTYEPEKGRLSWQLSVAPGESWERTFRFVVRYPKQKPIIGL